MKFRGLCYVDIECKTLSEAARFEARLRDLSETLKQDSNGLHHEYTVRETRNTKSGPPDINKMKFRSN